jgi:tryptophan-rich sensory protein
MTVLTSLKWLNIVAFVLVILVNSLAGSTTLIGGQNTASVSDSNPTLVTPAGYVFSIWGVIYVLLGVFVIYQALPGRKGEYQEKISFFFVLSSIFNIVWLFLWQYEFLCFSVVLMFLLLFSLIAIYVRLGVGKSKVPMRERLAIHLLFSVYLGWITIASIANVATTLVSVSWNGLGIPPETWATLIIIIASLIALLVAATRVDFAYGLVIIWALMGIAVKQSQNPNIVLLAQISAVVVGIAEAARIIFSRTRNR